MIWNQDVVLFDWLIEANLCGSGFVSSIAEAAQRADAENYAILRPALLQLREKYPQYNERRENVRQEKTGAGETGTDR